MAKTTLIINEKMPGFNNSIEAAKTHAKKYAELKKRYTNLVVRELIAQKCIPRKPYKEMKVSYEFHEAANGVRDPDNALSAMKFIHDAFVTAGLIEDDDMFHIKFGSIDMDITEKHSVEVSWTVKE